MNPSIKKKNVGKKVTLIDLLFAVSMELISEGLTKAGKKLLSISSTQYGIFGEVNGETILLNTCSKIYELVPNAQIFPVVEKILKRAGIKFTVEYRMLDYSRFYAYYTLHVGGISVGNKKDVIYPILIIEHSYNGLVKYNLTFGYFRLLCTNGLTVPVEGSERINFTVTGKHTKQILESLSKLMDKVTYFTKNQKRYTERFHEVADRWIEKWEDRVAAVIEATGVGKRGFEQITQQIRKESAELYNGKVNDWLIYNGINYHIFNAVTSDGKEYATAPHLRRADDQKVWETIYNNPNTADLKRKTTKRKKVEVTEN
jgi:hypothetical protein